MAQAQPPPITLADVRRVVCDAVASNAGALVNKKVDTYDGRISADAIEFIDNYVDVTTSKGWDDQQRFTNFNQFLTGAARIWYKLYVRKAAHPPADWDALKQAFLNYHVPADRTNALREQMVRRKQSPNEDVIQYITEKRLLCLEFNSNMTFAEMKRYIIEGLIPEIRATILHKVNADMAALETNAKNIEKGLRDSGLVNSNHRDKEMDELKNMFKQLMESKRPVSRERYENKEYANSRYDRHGRKIIRNNDRDRYMNLSRSQSRDSDRSLSNESDYYRSNPFRPDSRERYRNRYDRPKTFQSAYNSNENYRNSNRDFRRNRDRNNYNNRGHESEKRVEFDLARNISKSRNINGEIICFECNKPGHFARNCSQRDRKFTQRDKYRANVVDQERIKLASSLIYHLVDVNGVQMQAIIDTGSQISMIDDDIRKGLGLELEPSKDNVYAVNNQKVAIEGETLIYVSINLQKIEKCFPITALSIKNFNYDILLGNNFMQSSNIFIDCKHQRLLWSDNVEVKTEPKPKFIINKIHLLNDALLEPKKTSEVRITIGNAKNIVQNICKISTNKNLFQKNGIYVKSCEVQFICGEAIVPIVNCQLKPILLRSGTVVGSYTELEPEPQPKCSAYKSETDASILSSDIDSDKENVADPLKDPNESQTLINSALKQFKCKPDLVEAMNSAENVCIFCNQIHSSDQKCEKIPDWLEIEEFRFRKDKQKRNFQQSAIELVTNNLWAQTPINMPKEMKDSKGVINLGQGIVKVGETLTYLQRDQLRNLLLKYKDVFAFDSNKIGLCEVDKFRLRLKDPNQEPIKINPYSYSMSQRKEINDIIKQWIGMGIAEPCVSDYGFPVVLMNKKTLDPNGKPERRLAVDFRKLNKICRDDRYPIPDTKTCLSQLAGAKYFSLIDQNSGYMQFEIEESDRHKTAFRTQDGLYQFKRLAFGFKNAPSFFMRCMDKVYGDLAGKIIIIYFDDGIIFSKDFEEHLLNLKTVFDCLRKSGLTLKPSKCEFLMETITFLGFKISAKGIDADPAKIKAIVNFPRPTNLTAVRSFVGLSGFYRRKVPKFAQIAEPLTRLTKKVNEEGTDYRQIALHKKRRPSDEGRVFEWREEQENAFNTLKKAITSSPILVHFDSNLPIQVHTDGSLKGIGGALYHVIDDELHPFCFQSWLLNSAEKNYSIPEIECLAVVKVSIKCQTYLIGKPFTVVTDCLALKWMNEKSSLNSRLMRWSLHMQSFEYKVIHRMGKRNVVPDSLSRFPVDEPEELNDNIDERCLSSSVETPESEFQTELPELQKRDNNFGKLYKKLEKGGDESLSAKYCIENGVLFKKILYRNEPRLTICLPIIKVLEVLYTYHCDPLSGSHLGISKTTDKIAQRFVWPHMRKDIIDYVHSCNDCQHKKKPLLPKAGLMIPIQTTYPFELVGVDFLGRFKTSQKGNTYIIVATDYFTKWAIVKAIPAATKENAADFLINEVICKYGAIGRLLSDRGKQFLSGLSQQIYKMFGIKHLTTSSYHPQTNGLTEKYNQTLAKMISSYVNKSQDLWDENLQMITFGYNTSLNNTTGFSPYKLLFGRDPVLPPDITTGAQYSGYENERQLLTATENSLKELHKLVFENNKKASERNKTYYDRKHREVSYEVGQKVLVYYPTRIVGRSEKLMSPFHGPFTITKVNNNGVNYEIEAELDNRTKLRDTVHCSRIKPYFEREELISRLENQAKIEIECLSSSEDSDQESIRVNPKSESSETEIYEYIEPPKQTPPEISPETIKTPPLRRSTRVRRPPKIFNLLTITLIGLLLICNPCSASLQKLNPIVWRKSNKPVVTGVNRVLVLAGYQSPCDIFLDKTFIPYNNEQLKEFCDKRFQEDYINPLKRFCKTPDLLKEANKRLLVRKKRIAILAIGLIAIFVISVISIVGVVTKNTIQSSNSNAEIVKLKAQQLELLERTKTLEENQMKVKEIISLLQEQVDGLGEKVQTLTQSIKLLEEVVPHFVVYVAHIVSKLSIAREKLIESDREWKEGGISPKLLELFNITLPCLPDCKIEFAEPRECLHNEDKQTIQLMFDIKVNRNNASILRADPFTLYSIENKTLYCPIKYIGPENVVYNEKTDCIIPLPSSPYTLNNLVVMPKTETCQSTLPHNITRKYWKVEPCEQRHHISVEEVVQIKAVGENNHIFCNGFEITLYNRTINCPEFVFALPITSSFSIESLQYQTTDITIQSDLKFVPDLSQRINFALMPDLHNLQFTEMSNSVRRKLDELKFNEYRGHFDSYQTFDITDLLVITALFVFVSVFSIIHFRKRLRGKILRINKNRDTESIEMNEQVVDEASTPLNPSVPPTPSIKPEQKAKANPNKYLFLTTLIFFTMCEVSAETTEFLTINIYYENLCNELKYEFSTSEAKNWCQEHFRESFIEPIKKFCVDSDSHKSIDRIIFGKNKFERKAPLDLATTTDMIPRYESIGARLGMANLAAKFLIIKRSLIKMGMKWSTGEIDEQFITSEYLAIKMEGNDKLNEFEPHSCLFDPHCQYLRLELKKKIFYNSISKITGWKNTEDILLSILAITSLILLIISVKLRKVYRQREFAMRFVQRDRSNRLMNDNHPTPPPYSDPVPLIST